ncbi:MAG TPA: SDR family oxidoreductase [Verrucomicrobiae bacterium]|nr:SDR family oxidoreductase [Verrucomicrobiae bacterium]
MTPRTIFLTGASSGIGLETAKLLTAGGFEVWGTSRNPARLPRLPHFHPVEMDLLRPDSIRRGFAEALNESGSFDVLINNAGAGLFGPLESLPPDAVAAQFQLLVQAPLELIRLALPAMRARGRGTIVNVTSLAALLPIPFMAPYSAAKAALSSFTEALRVELSNTAIKVVEVRPGDINTTFHNATKRMDTVADPADQRRVRAAWETELRNMAAAPSPERVARTVRRAITNPNPPPVVTVGGFFQARVAPWGVRLLPPRLLEWALRRYYGI